MTVLTILTIAYAAVLVGALAVSLVLILLRLRRIAHALGGVHAALGLVRDRTAPLAQNLERLHRAAVGGDTNGEPAARVSRIPYGN
jgi:hypothetical protein